MSMMKHKFQWVQKAGTVSAALLCVALLGGCSNGKPPAQKAPPEVMTISVEKESVLLTSDFPGRTSAYRVAEIRPQVNGVILKRLFEEGSDVQAGQSLYQIDPAPFEAAVNSARAALERAQANLPAVQLRQERYKLALENKAVSQQDYDDASAALKQAQADILYYQAMLDNAQINLNYSKVISPLTGRIGTSSVTDGATVTAYQPVPLATVQQLDPIYVDVPQSTSDMLRLRKRFQEGLLTREKEVISQVELILDDGSIYKHKGELQFRDISVDPTTSTTILRIIFPNPEGDLLPGMFVRAIVREGEDRQALMVPQETVSRDRKGDAYVMIVENGVALQQIIQLDRAIGNKWLIASGLTEEEHIVLEGLQNINHQTPVNEVYSGIWGKEAKEPQAQAQPAQAQPAQAEGAGAQPAAPQE